jgi:phage baseplate assembly protein W
MQERVENALRLWEPRIRLSNVEVEADPADEQQVVITIEYTLVASGEPQGLALTVSLAG